MLFKVISRFSSLRKLYVSYNQLNGYLPKHFQPSFILESLDLSFNHFSGSLPSFTPFSHLKDLSLSGNNFSGSIPDFKGLQSLNSLDLAGNHFSGSIPDFMGLQSLEVLLLNGNNFSGQLPNFTGLQSLNLLNLTTNKFSGKIPDFTGCLSLEGLWLGGNEITAWETQSIGQLTNLEWLDLSRNSLNNTITESHMSNLSKLDTMDASSNSLTFNFSSRWLPPFQLSELYLASSKLGPEFPNWIRNQKAIMVLNFSNCQISDSIPSWFWNISTSLEVLDLSSNQIRGQLSSSLFYIDIIDLSFNYLEGPVPLLSFHTWKINLSQNKFSGDLFFLSTGRHLTFLYCSHNLFSGALPDSWVNFLNLTYVDVGYNNLSGIIPTSIGHLLSLQTLILRNNSFHGGFPDSPKNCSKLGFVDFGLNSLSGKIPEWIGDDLPELYALTLKSNNFYGSIPYHLCHLSNLHFLDLSINKISGSVPTCFGNFSSMIHKQNRAHQHIYTSPNLRGTPGYHQVGSYDDSAFASWKGIELKYERNFAYLMMLDLSSNELTGEIPIKITRLLLLNGLNLSRNKFYGKIPEEIGGLKMLESLDLSRNMFSGEIPQSMSELQYLGYLDLSSNNLSGRIPSGTQLQGFDVSTYEQNVKLCGPPLKKLCPGDEPNVEVHPSSDGNDAAEDETEYEKWLYISAALGFSTTFWGICGILVLNRHWRHAYFLFLNNLKDRLFVIMAIHIAKLRN